jgi:uncharacterized protein Veg
MFSDSINDEIRGIRRDLAAQFGNDLDLILADIRRREASDSRTYVSLSPRVYFQETDEQTDAPEAATTSFSPVEASLARPR